MQIAFHEILKKFIFSDRFDVLMSKIIFFKKNYFDAFLNEKHFEKQPSLSHF
jgi:hypothetical protein